MNSSFYEFWANDRINTWRREAHRDGLAAAARTTRRPKISSRRLVPVAAVALSIGAVLGSAGTLAAVGGNPAAATSPTAPALATSDDDPAMFPGDEADDPGYGDGFGGGRTIRRPSRP